jgi:L-lactate dehydrogenase complex protein LldG
MNARTRILERIANALGRDKPAPIEIEQMENHFRRHARGPGPTITGDLAKRLCERALMLGSTIEQVATFAAVPRAAAEYLDAHRLPRRAVCWPAFAGLAWQAQGINMEARSATASDLIGITGAFCAIAETGTLMLLSGPATPATTSLLPETHIAILPLGRIVATMEDAWGLLRAEGKPMPRAVNLVSGPSRTADIEQTVTLGAHGPYRVHIVIVAQTA